jgi:hypothetical protein
MSPIDPDLWQAPVAHQFPIAVEYVAKLGAPIIAALALAVTFVFTRRQWQVAFAQRLIADSQRKIAQQRVALDLFNERLSVYTGIRETILNVIMQERASVDDLNKFRTEQNKIYFLFGDDVCNYMELAGGHLVESFERGKRADKLEKEMTRIQALPGAANRQAQLDENAIRRRENGRALMDAQTKLMDIHKEMGNKFKPYMKMHMKTLDDLH